MDIPKKYFHDRIILLLATINLCLAVVTSVLILLRFSAGHSGAYFVQYRANLGLNAYKTGSSLELLSFIVFAVLVLAGHLVISMRLYTVRREYSVAVLAAGTLLLVLGLVVSNALLMLAH